MKFLQFGIGSVLYGFQGATLYELISWNDQREKEGDLKRFSLAMLSITLVSFPILVLRKKMVFGLAEKLTIKGFSKLIPNQGHFFNYMTNKRFMVVNIVFN